MANNNGVEWFFANVFDHLPSDHKFHIAGSVRVPSTFCKCSAPSKLCESLHPRVHCHGSIDDDELDQLIRFVRLTINPILETSGVSTKTCRSMALGTPVVTTDFDGTFTEDMTVQGSVRCSRIKRVSDYATCFIENITSLLNEEQTWQSTAISGPTFVARNYAMKTYIEDWVNILDALREEERHKILIYDDLHDPMSAVSQIAWTINNMNDFDVILTGEQDAPPSFQFIRIPDSSISGSDRWLAFFSSMRKINIFITLTWPPNNAGDEGMIRSVCSHLLKCQVVQVLPWELKFIDDACMNKHLATILDEAAKESILRPCK